jgi:hypothetical protein
MTTVPHDSKCDLLIRAVNTFPFFLLTPLKHDICKRVAVLNPFNADTDPAFHFSADPDPIPAPYHSGKSATTIVQTLQSSVLSLYSSIVSVQGSILSL